MTEGVEHLVGTFVSAGLRVPPIPDRFVNAMRAIAPWAWATRAVEPMEMYLFERYVAEALAGSAPEYLAVCHAGHGVNSYGICYHLVNERLAIFAQVAWGGAYGNAAIDAATVAACFTRITALLAVECAEPADGSRVVLAFSDFRGVSCAGRVAAVVPEARRAWCVEHECPEPFRTAAALLRDV